MFAELHYAYGGLKFNLESPLSMPSAPNSTPITLHPALGMLDPLVVATGPSIPPIDRVGLFSPSDWEAFVNEWAASLDEYVKVERASGAGDRGCDVIAIPKTSPLEWDNYQCKHYEQALIPSKIWVELGKVCYYTFTGAYTLPRRYRFVAPKDVGTSLAALFRKPSELKASLISSWDSKCLNSIRTNNAVPLDADLLNHIQGLDFSVFGYTPVLKIIEQHKTTPHYIARFGLGLPPRPSHLPPPEIPQSHETRYVQQLFEAYEDNTKSNFTNSSLLPTDLQRHFHRSRESFYSAEALRNFSRDTLPSGTFEGLQDQVHDGVIDTCESTHSCGLTRLKKTTAHAATLSITSSPLIGKTDITDIHGICHQLANDDRLTWVPKGGQSNGE
jgi:hypothetical protein